MRHFGWRTVNRPRVVPSVTVLERRLTPAGTVKAAFLDGVLTLTGDDQANDLTLSGSAGSYTVTGNKGTTITGTIPASGVTSIQLVLNGGDDVVALDANFSLAGALNLNAGSGNNTADLTAAGISLKSFVYSAGEGFDTVKVSATITGGINIKTGNGGSAVAIGGTASALTVTSGEGTDIVTLDTFTTGGKVKLALGTGDDVVQVAGVTAVGSFLYLGGADANSFLLGTSKTPATFNVGGLMNLQLGAGTGEVELYGNLTVGTDLKIASRDGLSVAFDAITAINRDLILNGGVGLYLGVTEGLKVSRNGNFSATLTSDISLGSAVTIGGNLTVTGGSLDDTFTANDQLDVSGNVKINLKAGFNLVQIDTVAADALGSLSVTGGAGVDTLIVNRVTINRGLKASLGSGNNVVQLGISAPVTILGALNLTTTNGDDVITLLGVSVGKTATINTGNGADLLAIDDSTFTGAVTIFTLGGDDEIRLEQSATAMGVLTFAGQLALNAGPGNDTLLAGVNGVPTQKVIFSTAGPTTLNGGPNLNTFDPSAGNIEGPFTQTNWTV